MLPNAVVAHSAPGRTRIKIPSKVGDGGYFAKVAAILRQLPQVRSVQANLVTGSVLLAHAGGASQLLNEAEKSRLFKVAPQPLQHASLAHEGALSHRVSSWLPAEIAGVAGLTLLGLGVVQASRQKFLPAGLTLLFQAAELLAASRR